MQQMLNLFLGAAAIFIVSHKEANLNQLKIFVCHVFKKIFKKHFNYILIFESPKLLGKIGIMNQQNPNPN